MKKTTLISREEILKEHIVGDPSFTGSGDQEWHI